MQLDSPSMVNILMARHFDQPVCHIGGKHYIVARAYPSLPLGLVLEITNVRQRLLGDFYVIDWEAELLERITPTKMFRDAVKALREDETLDFEPAFSTLDFYTMALQAAEKIFAENITSDNKAAAIIEFFYDQCLAAEAIDIRMLNDTLPALCKRYGIKPATDRSFPGWREPAVKVVLLLAKEVVGARCES